MSLDIVPITWLANSLVGHMIKAIAFLLMINLFINGIVNAKVLPVPVCAVPSTSFPSSAIGIAWDWIGVGVIKFEYLIEFFSLFSMSNSLKFFMLDSFKDI